MKQLPASLIYLVSAGILFSVPACNSLNCISGSGKQVSQNRSADAFSSVETSGSVKLILKQDSAQQIKIVADDNIQEHIKTRVSGDKLTIDMDGNFCNAGPITVYLSAKHFSGVDASGAVEVISNGKINTTDFDLELSGSSKVNLDLNAANLKTHSSGSSEISLKGQASNHQVDLSGSGNIEALDFVVGNYRIKTSGASKCSINVLNELVVKSSGASEILYRGNPKNVSNDDSGASSLKKID